MSGQRAPMRVRMSSPRENTQAMAICAMVTPLGVCDGLDRVNDGKVSVKASRSRSIRARTGVFNSARSFEMTRSAFLGFRRKRLQTIKPIRGWSPPSSSHSLAVPERRGKVLAVSHRLCCLKRCHDCRNPDFSIKLGVKIARSIRSDSGLRNAPFGYHCSVHC
jgi:hypothetical protein